MGSAGRSEQPGPVVCDPTTRQRRLWQVLPGYETVQRADWVSGTRPGESLPGAAFVEEGAACHLARKALGDPDADVDEETRNRFRPITAEDVAATLRVIWKDRLKRWQ